MDALSLAVGLAGTVVAIIAVLVAALPAVREWYYDYRNLPLRVEVVRPFTKVNPAFGAFLRLRIHNRVRSGINVSVSPATSVTITTDRTGRTEAKGTLFDEPEPTVYPSREKAWSFWLPGHDCREIELRLPVTTGVLRGRERVAPIVFANRFRVQEIRLGPYDFEVDPANH